MITKKQKFIFDTLSTLEATKLIGSQKNSHSNAQKLMICLTVSTIELK